MDNSIYMPMEGKEIKFQTLMLWSLQGSLLSANPEALLDHKKNSGENNIMATTETLGILQEIETLVSDQLQVVSYKWLSRNFMLPSNAAKRLLQEFVESCRSAVEVVYTLSGWLKKNPSSYHIKLVSGRKLEEAKKEFDENCSVQVYSVQACIPKDPNELWNAEFVQAGELFKKSSIVDNCLRSNRLCGIFNSCVKCVADETPTTIASPLPKGLEVSRPSKSNCADEIFEIAPPPQKVLQSGSNFIPKCPNVVNDIKTGSSEQCRTTKPPADKDKVCHQTANKTKGQIDKNSSVNGGSLVNLWGSASGKSKPATVAAKDNKLIVNTHDSAEASVSIHELIENRSSDDEAQDVNFKRASNGGEGNRKRRVVFDYSDDEYEGAVSISSPHLPKEQRDKSFLSDKVDSCAQTEDNANIKVKGSTDISCNQPLCEKSSTVTKIGDQDDASSLEKVHGQFTGDIGKDIIVNNVPCSPKRRKVLKTKIDERGREVTEVIWEGDDMTTKKEDSNATKKSEKSGPASNVNNRAPATKSSPAPSANIGSKGGNKKGGHKDPRQGNILSFFKKV